MTIRAFTSRLIVFFVMGACEFEQNFMRRSDDFAMALVVYAVAACFN